MSDIGEFGGSGSGGGGRIILPDNAVLDLYVATTGNDVTGDGSVGNPWATINHATTYVADKLYNDTPHGATVTIHVADGTYTVTSTTGSHLLPSLDSTGQIGTYINPTLSGNVASPGNVILNCDSSLAFGSVLFCNGHWVMQGFKFESSAAVSTNHVSIGQNGFLQFFDSMEFGKAGSDSQGWIINCGNAGLSAVSFENGTVTISGQSYSLIFAQGHANSLASGYFLFANLVLTVDPLWPGGCIAGGRLADFAWGPGSVTGTSSGPQLDLEAGSRLVLFTALSTIPGASLGIVTGSEVIDTATNHTWFYNKTADLTSGALSLGKAGTVTGAINFTGTTSGTVKLSTQDAAGTWTLKLPTTAGTNTWFLQTDGVGNTTWAAGGGGGGGSPGTPLNSVQWNSAGSFAGAAHTNIVSGQINVDAGFTYLYAGSKNALFAVTNVAGDNFFEGEAGNFTLTGSANFGTGTNALAALTTGSRNLAVGVAAGAGMTTGAENVALGFDALQIATNPQSNVAMGSSAMGVATGGSNNIAIGVSALNSNTTGTGNFALGFHSMILNTTGSANVGIGASTLQASVADVGNVAIGPQCLQSLNGANGNTAIGSQVLTAVVTGGQNTGIGNAALNVATGSFNTAVGSQCLTNPSGSNNTAIGFQCGAYLVSGANNIFVGYQSGFNVTGSNNTLMGYLGAASITTGSNNLILGDGVDTGSNVSGCIVIGQNATNRLDYNLTNSGKWTAKAAMVLPVSAVGSLPTGVAGAMAFVNDATQTMTAGVGAIVAGGGANTVPVYHDGTNWRIG